MALSTAQVRKMRRLERTLRRNGLVAKDASTASATDFPAGVFVVGVTADATDLAAAVVADPA